VNGKGCCDRVAPIVEMRRRQARAAESAGTATWWKEVLAGEVAARHPIHGDELKVKLRDGRLVLAGEVQSRAERDQLVREARSRIGHGLHELDVSGLKIRPKNEKAGVLGQTIVAAYDHPDTAELALTFVMEHTRSKPLRATVVRSGAKLVGLLPPELVSDAQRELDRGHTLLVVEVDETEAYRVRALLEEDTRSTWTVAAPPHIIGSGSR
jgi:hypothetical protein